MADVFDEDGHHDPRAAVAVLSYQEAVKRRDPVQLNAANVDELLASLQFLMHSVSSLLELHEARPAEERRTLLADAKKSFREAHETVRRLSSDVMGNY